MATNTKECSSDRPEKFKTGFVVITSPALQVLDPHHVDQSLKRHKRGDWGDVCEHDRRENTFALAHGERLLSIYHDNGRKYWIITERDRSVTTVLLPEDY